MSYDTLDNAATQDGGEHEGHLLADRYRIARKLGEGGMGMVYLAVDTELADHAVAIKFIPPMLAGNARAIKNLKREALTAMQLSHPNIVRLHDLHTDGHQKFLVMEYIEGQTLDDVLGEAEGECLPLDRVLEIVEQLAAGLDHAHSKQVLHRDLKPSNIMVGDDGAVKLLDFGIAREIKDSYTRMTGNLTSGTLPYMSPEQLMGAHPTVAMDVYSLGAVTYECLAGHPPFHMGDIRRQIEVKEPDPIAALPAHVNSVLLRVLDKESVHRPTSAGALAQALKAPAPSMTDTAAAAPDPAPVRVPETPPTPTENPAIPVPPQSSQPMAPMAVPIVKLPTPPKTELQSSAPQATVASHRKPVLSKALLVGSLVFAAGNAAERIVWHILMIAGLNPSVANLISILSWALLCGVGTVFCLRLLKVSQNKRMFVGLPLAWGTILAALVPINSVLIYHIDLAPAVVFSRIVGALLSGVVLWALLRLEGLRLSLRRNLLLVLGWLVGALLGWLVGGLLGGGLIHPYYYGMRGLVHTVATGLGGAVQGAFYVYLLYCLTGQRRGRVETPAPKITPSPQKLSSMQEQGGTLNPGGRKPRWLRACLANGVLWGIGMGLGFAIFVGLDHRAAGEVFLAATIAGFWGFWCGAATGWSLRLAGLFQNRKIVLRLAVIWGMLWLLATATAVTLGEEMDAIAMAFVVFFLGILGSVAAYVGLLRRAGWKLSIPRILLMTWGWLIGIVVHVFVSVIFTAFLFDGLMGIPEEIAIVMGTGIGGMTLGCLSLGMTYALVVSQHRKMVRQEL